MTKPAALAAALLLLVSALAAADEKKSPQPIPTAETQKCGGIIGLRCTPPLWCEPKAGLCGGADIPGTCVETPRFCTRIYRPVCGCDGKTYPNDCERRAAHVALDREGACDAPAPPRK